MADLPPPDAIEGAPHPRETQQLLGQQNAEADFLASFNADRLHSGWLITGPRGTGKATLAYRIAHFLLATPPADGLFGAPPPATSLDIPEGPDLHQILAGAHPRLCVVTRGPNSTGSALSDVISIDRVRAIKDFFHMSAADGGRRVVIVDDMDALNRSAANALLKELEEPPANTTLLLVAHQPSRLLPTIRSRCRVLRVAPLGAADLSAALDQAGFDGASDGLARLSNGSVGDAIRLMQFDGIALYAQLVELLATAPRLDRARANALADSLTGRANDARFQLAMDLLDRLLARLARAGLIGPGPEITTGEAQLLARLSPHDVAARAWAEQAAAVQDRLRHGRAVNIDSSALMLDALLAIDETARRIA